MALTRIETIIDGIENYDIGTTISRTPYTKISVATSRRGRLKGRKVALKMVPKNSDQQDFDENAYRATLQLHRHLHHPDILSLLSTFETPSAFYEVLEYAPYGSLSEWISKPKGNGEINGAPILSEAQLRGILQPLIKALLHMHQNDVIHLNVNPNHIFVTSDHRVKLGGFQYCRNFSAKLSPFLQKRDGFVLGHKAPIYHQKSAFSAPEILMQERPGPPADVWSLGQLCVLLSNGSLQDGLWNQSIPGSASYDLRDLIEGLTQADAADRPPLRRLMSHPFFNPKLPSDNLSAFITMGSRGSQHSTVYNIESGRSILGSANTSRHRPSRRPSARTISSGEAPVVSRDALHNIGQVASVLVKESSLAGSQLERRHPLVCPTEVSAYGSFQRPLKVPNLEPSNMELESGRPASPPAQRRPNSPRLLVNAGALPAQSFRTTHGMIMIQPSRAVIVDLREGERMKGRDGRLILVVQPDGHKVDAYSAPHLSVPCVLQKPASTWEVRKLPSALGKPYEYAAKYLQAIKRKTPMVTLNLSASKFVVMSNTPVPDIEITIPCPIYGKDSLGQTEPTIWLRFSRQENTLEISKFTNSGSSRLVSGPTIQLYTKHPGGGSEWSKRVIPLVRGNVNMAEIREDERKAVNCLQSSRHLWEGLERTAIDMDHRISNGLNDQFLTIRSRLDSPGDTIQARASPPPRESPKENISFYPSPDSMKEVEEGENTSDPKPKVGHSVPSTKPRLLGLGLPPRPRKLSLSNLQLGSSTPFNTATISGRRRSSVHWSTSVGNKP